MRRRDKRPPAVKRKSKVAHPANERQRAALRHPANFAPLTDEIRERLAKRRERDTTKCPNPAFLQAGIASARVDKAEKKEIETERPWWMSDPALLPKRPPGK